MNPFEKPIFVPAVDDWLVVQLPGERTRALVRGQPDDDTVIVELLVQPMMIRQHRYRKGDLVPCRRKHTGMEEIWESVDEAQLRMAEALQRLKEEREGDVNGTAPAAKEKEPEPTPAAKSTKAKDEPSSRRMTDKRQQAATRR